MAYLTILSFDFFMKFSITFWVKGGARCLRKVIKKGARALLTNFFSETGVYANQKLKERLGLTD